MNVFFSWCRSKVHSANLSSFLNGRVIKLGLTCLPPEDQPCLMFKLKGTVSCKLLSSCTFSQNYGDLIFKP